MKTLHYEAGAIAARNNEPRVAPRNLTPFSRPFHDWYEGHDNTMDKLLGVITRTGISDLLRKR